MEARYQLVQDCVPELFYGRNIRKFIHKKIYRFSVKNVPENLRFCIIFFVVFLPYMGILPHIRGKIPNFSPYMGKNTKFFPIYRRNIPNMYNVLVDLQSVWKTENWILSLHFLNWNNFLDNAWKHTKFDMHVVLDHYGVSNTLKQGMFSYTATPPLFHKFCCFFTYTACRICIQNSVKILWNNNFFHIFSLEHFLHFWLNFFRISVYRIP